MADFIAFDKEMRAFVSLMGFPFMHPPPGKVLIPSGCRFWYIR